MTARKSEKLTIRDLAKQANLSTATISRAIRPETRHKVTPETLRVVDALVEKHRFAPNLAAQNLRSTRYQTLGILVPHIQNVFVSDYWSKIVSGFSNALIDSSFRFKIVAIKPYVRKWDNYHFQSAEGVDGLIVGYWPTFFSPKFDVDVPSVAISDPSEKAKTHFVCADNVHGGELAAQCLYENGHERIAILTGHEWSTDSAERVAGFRNYFRRVGTAIPQEMIFRANYEADDASAVVERIFMEKNKVTAIFCCNDYMAVGALRKLKQLGISCPGRVSVIGFDDDACAAQSDPPLTTIRVPTSDLGRMAAVKLMDHLSGTDKNNFFHRRTVLPVSLVNRQTVAKAR